MVHFQSKYSKTILVPQHFWSLCGKIKTTVSNYLEFFTSKPCYMSSQRIQKFYGLVLKLGSNIIQLNPLLGKNEITFRTTQYGSKITQFLKNDTGTIKKYVHGFLHISKRVFTCIDLFERAPIKNYYLENIFYSQALLYELSKHIKIIPL